MNKTKEPDPGYWIDVDLFGDICEIAYDTDKKRMIAIGQVGSADMERMLKAIATAFKSDKTKRGQRISANAEALAKDYYMQQKHKLRTRAMVANGPAIKLETKQIVIDCEKS